MTAPKQTEIARILLGRITGAHGIKGDVTVHSYAAAAEDIASYGALTDAQGRTTYKLKLVGSTAKGLIGRIAGVSDRNAAEALRGTELYVERAKLPAADAEEFYHADLIGLAAVTPEGAPLGEIIAVENFGAGDLLELKLSSPPAKNATELIPFTAAYVPSVDIAARRIVIVMPVAAPVDPADGPEPPDEPIKD
jgi:16S rRNA processing protein RimM